MIILEYFGALSMIYFCVWWFGSLEFVHVIVIIPQGPPIKVCNICLANLEEKFQKRNDIWNHKAPQLRGTPNFHHLSTPLYETF